jgi:hypothetical protein
MERPLQPQALRELTPQLVTILTTEHFTLQSAQAQEVEDINGRTALFIGAISGTLIALAFIGQLSHVGTAFAVFSLVLFPSLVFMGLVTVERTMQSTYAVITYARGMSRLRHLYLEYAPQLAPYFILSSHDETASITGSVGITPSWWQLFLITPGMIAVINSVLVGTFVGLLLSYVFLLSLLICVGVAVVAFLISLGVQQWRHWRYRMRTEQSVPTLFPRESTQRTQ